MKQVPSFLIIIPSRYNSTRFPGKPLAKIAGIEMVARCMQRVASTGIETIVATDDERIAECVAHYGGRAVMTPAECASGTDRACSVLDNVENLPDVVINVQGDEPFIDPSQIEKLKNLFIQYPDTRIATLIRPFSYCDDYESLANPNKVKVVVDDYGRALYFSRSVIPFVRGAEPKTWPGRFPYHTHIGIYAYTTETLRQIAALPQSSLEKSESLEQLRWLQAGIPIMTAVSVSPTIGIDTPEDLLRAERWLASHPECG